MRAKNCMMFMMLFAASGAVADARYSIANPHQPSHFRLEYAQVQVDDLSESDLRRLIFYADRATGTLQNLVESADTQSIFEQEKVNKRFRESIVRLADAGDRSGLSMDQVADFYEAVVFDRFGQEFMQKVGALAGGLEFRTLFRNIATASETDAAGRDANTSYINSLAESSQLNAPLSEGQAIQPSPVQVIDRPVALPNANADELSIVDRVRVVDGRWELTVQTGDSLSTIASAIYGDSLAYTTIYSANSEVIANPNVIEVDTLLVLPRP